MVGLRDFGPRGKLLIIFSTHFVFASSHHLLLVVTTPQLSTFCCQNAFEMSLKVEKYLEMVKHSGEIKEHFIYRINLFHQIDILFFQDQYDQIAVHTQRGIDFLER